MILKCFVYDFEKLFNDFEMCLMTLLMIQAAIWTIIVRSDLQKGRGAKAPRPPL